jgi:predicted CXXCH cytochrome family protein
MLEGSRGGLSLLLVLSAVWASRLSRLSAEESADHPFLGKTDLKPETCLKCHPTKNQGKFVHAVVEMGCDNCHVIAASSSGTVITLQATGGALCAKCHETKKSPVRHGPYQAGQCLICHNPHSSDYPAQTRAAADTLCRSCHMLNQPEVMVNTLTRVVSLLDGRTYDLTSWQSTPKISADHAANRRRGTGGTELIIPETRKSSAEASCVSCHDPHASKADHLLRGADGDASKTRAHCGAWMGVSSRLRYIPAFRGSSFGVGA